MDTFNNMENILLAIMGVVMLVLFIPSTKAAIERSKQAKADWAGLILPLGLVIAFVFFLIAMVN